MIQDLSPQLLWKNFANLNAVPRPSKKEEKVIKFIQEYGKSLGLETITDKTGNVLIKKPATEGMGERKRLILQSHLDMVHQKNNETNFDFDKEGIKMYVDGDWVKAEGTTLGSDNGIGVAAIMALLESTDIPHPELEALFTIDEETGMTGAFGLEAGFLSGDILLNLDTEDDDELTIGCAGGINVSVDGKYEQINNPYSNSFKITIKGLSGGHSGMDIHKGLGNANKLMNRFLFELSKKVKFALNEIQGGGLRNAIPRESNAIVSIESKDIDALKDFTAEMGSIIKAEYKETDPEAIVEINEVENASKAAHSSFTDRLLAAVYAVPVGIYRMSPSIAGMVQTSNNLAQVSLSNGEWNCLCLCRSSVDSEKLDEANAIQSAFAGMDAKVQLDGDYPGWEPRPQSDIVDLMANLYREMFEGEPNVNACHAGLECGIIGSHYPKLDMVSFGPNIRGAHSPDEKVQISSVQKFWKFLLETIKRTPLK